MADRLHDVHGIEGNEPAADGGIRPVQTRPHTSLGVPGERYIITSGRVGRSGDRDTDEGRPFDHLFVRGDDNDRSIFSPSRAGLRGCAQSGRKSGLRTWHGVLLRHDQSSSHELGGGEVRASSSKVD